MLKYINQAHQMIILGFSFLVIWAEYFIKHPKTFLNIVAIVALPVVAIVVAGYRTHIYLAGIVLLIAMILAHCVALATGSDFYEKSKKAEAPITKKQVNYLFVILSFPIIFDVLLGAYLIEFADAGWKALVVAGFAYFLSIMPFSAFLTKQTNRQRFLNNA